MLNVVCSCLFVGLFLVCSWFVLRYFAKASKATGGPVYGPVAILQPILSGDPGLEKKLSGNSARHPSAVLYWLVDEDDPEGEATARRAAGENVRIVVGPGPLDGENPKAAKLARALELVREPVAVVLDDDTHIGVEELARLTAALGEADLVTGLPVFVSTGTVFERFVGGFVNGHALLTYLPAAAVGAQHTINGMIYAVRTEDLRALGGFAAIVNELTDDYAMAQLYERQGRRVMQTTVCVEVGMTIRDAAHCGRVLRRWFLFANRYLRDNGGLATLLLVALPSMLPLGGLVLGVSPILWLPLLFAKVIGNRWLLWRVAGRRSGVLDVLFEMLADLLAPLFYLSSLVRPKEFSWRSRRMVMAGDRIRYR